MFSAKSLVVLVALAAQAFAHAAVAPAMGVSGEPIRADVQRPSTAKPCGKIALSKAETSTTIAMTGSSFTANATNFNPGKDGSMLFTASVDPTATGNSFTAVTITQNGPPAPLKIGTTAQLSVTLPAGTKCSGGQTKDLCVVSFESASGFGNCVVVKQQQGAASNPSVASNAGGSCNAPVNANATTSDSAPSATATTKKAYKNTRSRHPRNFAAISAKRDYAKRAISWVWAPSAGDE